MDIGPMKLKKSGWKVAESRNKKNKKIKLALSVLLIVAVTIFAGNIFKLVSSLFKPFNNSFDQRSYRWDGGSNLYLAARNDADKENISLIVFSPGDGKLSIVNIPSQTYVEVPGGYGSWQIRSIFDLGEKDRKGSAFLKSSLSDFFGLPIEGYIEFNILQVKNNPLNLLASKGNMRTDLTVLELIRLFFGLKGVRADKIVEFDLKSLGGLEEKSLADGSNVYVANTRLDIFTSENLADPDIRKEQLSIAVLNGTSFPGLAQKYSRMISNLGGNVIIADNSETQFKNSFVFGEESKTKKKLLQIFGSKYDKIEQPDSRAQVTVVLGEDLKPPP